MPDLGPELPFAKPAADGWVEPEADLVAIAAALYEGL
jgi:hypothetical protein